MSIESFASRAQLQPTGVVEEDMDDVSIVQLTNAWEYTGEVRDSKAARLKGGVVACCFNVPGRFIRAVLHYGRQARGLARMAADDVGVEYGTAAAVAAAAKVRPVAAAALEADASLFKLFDLRRPRSQKTVQEELCDLFLGCTAPDPSKRKACTLLADAFAVQHLQAWEWQLKNVVPPPAAPVISRRKAVRGTSTGGAAASKERRAVATRRPSRSAPTDTAAVTATAKKLL